MSNFECPHCGMINIDCGKEGYKTPREIELKKENKTLKSLNKHLTENGLLAKGILRKKTKGLKKS